MWSWLFPPTCPVDDDRRDWLDKQFTWLVDQFDLEEIRTKKIVLPTEEFFPETYDGSEEAAETLFRRVCQYMYLNPLEVELYFYEEDQPFDSGMPGEMRTSRGAAGLYSRGRKCRIGINRGQLSDQLATVATMAHELAHVHLLGHGRISEHREDHEDLTDLLTVVLGLGVITSNGAMREKNWSDGMHTGWSLSSTGYLDFASYGYALAFLARLREETKPAWSRQLRLNVRTPFDEAVRYLKKREKDQSM